MTGFEIIPIDKQIQGQLFVFSFFSLFILGYNRLQVFAYRNHLIMYILAVALSMIMIQAKSLSELPRWAAPLVIWATITPKEFKYYKPLSYLLIVFFVSNAVAAFYERFSGDYIREIEMDDEMMIAQMGYGEKDENNFRAFAFFGHPLWNANMMSFMSFILFFSNWINRNIRLFLLALGLSSLFCFNARGAIIISLILLLFCFKDAIAESKHKIWIFLAAGAVLSFAIFNFDIYAGRLVSTELLDSSGMVRVLSIMEYMDLPLETVLFGGYTPQFSENGYILILEQYGLFIGLLKIFIEIYLSYKIIDLSIEKRNRWIIMLSLIAVGSTNNNLAGPRMFPFYILCVLFIMLCGSSKYLSDKIS